MTKKNTLILRSIFLIGLCIICLPCFMTSCIGEDDYMPSESVHLKFSADTLTFDTIFTTMGSTTKKLMVYNPHDKPVIIHSVSLEKGLSSPYRLNVDGDTSFIAQNVEIMPKDSLYIFIRVTINPTLKNQPVLVEDAIVFSFKKSHQRLPLTAFGQDAYYHTPDYDSDKYFSYTNAKGKEVKRFYSSAHDKASERGCEQIGNNLRWKNDKPHIIFDICAVDSSFSLTIPEGTSIHMAPMSELRVFASSSLHIQGIQDAPVNIEGIRRDGFYPDLAGQWMQIWCMPGSGLHTISHATIKNGSIGIRIDSANSLSLPALTLENVDISNMSRNGILANGTTVNATNLKIQNTGESSVSLSGGGDYRFVHATLANYWNYSTMRRDPTLFINNKNPEDIFSNLSASFHNCIIYGSLSTGEIKIPSTLSSDQNILFNHCLLRIPTNFDKASTTDCIFSDPLFISSSDQDFHLQEDSPAIGAADNTWSLLSPSDLDGVLRKNPASIGAYEYVASD